MRKLSELEISPTPWECATNDRGEFVGTLNGCGFYVAKFAYDIPPNDARLIAAAPLLYNELYDAWSRSCSEHSKVCKDCAYNGLHCSRWRAALAKASGESEVGK